MKKKSYVTLGTITILSLIFLSCKFTNSTGSRSQEAYTIIKTDSGIKPSLVLTNPNPFVSYKDMVSIVESKPSKKTILLALKETNPHWRFKGEDPSTGEVFFLNTYLKNNKEILIWHSVEMIMELITESNSHCKSIIKELNTFNYRLTDKSTQDGDVTTQYSDGNTTVFITKVMLTGGRYDFKILIGQKR